VAACRAAGDEVVPVSRASGVDLRDPAAARAAVRDARPDVVHHLAALASVGRSWDDPAGTVRDNVAITAALLDAVRREAPAARVLVASSGEVYGFPAELPVTEDAPLRPQSPYAASKAAADLLAGFHADGYGLAVVRARAFNHAGPGQSDVYALSSFARQAAAGAEVIRTGNPESRRDFTDVRDVVRAYRLLAERGEPGEAYNVCSGVSTSTAELVELVRRAAGRDIRHEVDPARLRAHEVLDMRGAPDKLRAVTGWAPEIKLARTAADTLSWWSTRL
jgi:GDP-4-dehydro-6-deoxy-D-mannose reductase